MEDPLYVKYSRWRTEAARLRRVISEPPAASRLPAAIDVAAIRRRLGRMLGEKPISQAAFARRFGFGVGSIRDWEQKRSTPDPASRVLLLLIDRDPHLVDAVIDEAVEQAAAEQDRVKAVEFDGVRPSSLSFEVVRLERTLKRKQRSSAMV